MLVKEESMNALADLGEHISLRPSSWRDTRP